MTFKQRFIYRSAIGFALGFVADIVIHVLFMWIEHADKMGVSQILVDIIGNRDLAFVADLMLCGLLGLVCNGSAVIYDIEHWSILKVTVVHFVICVVCYFGFGMLLEWFEAGITSLNLIMFTIWLFAYVMIWLISYAVFKKEIREINRGVMQMRVDKS